MTETFEIRVHLRQSAAKSFIREIRVIRGEPFSSHIRKKAS